MKKRSLRRGAAFLCALLLTAASFCQGVYAADGVTAVSSSEDYEIEVLAGEGPPGSEEAEEAEEASPSGEVSAPADGEVNAPTEPAGETGAAEGDGEVSFETEGDGGVLSDLEPVEELVEEPVDEAEEASPLGEVPASAGGEVSAGAEAEEADIASPESALSAGGASLPSRGGVGEADGEVSAPAEPAGDTVSAPADGEVSDEASADGEVSAEVKTAEELIEEDTDEVEDLYDTDFGINIISENNDGSITATITAVEGKEWEGVIVPHLMVGEAIAYCMLSWAKYPVDVTADFTPYTIPCSVDGSSYLDLIAGIMYYGYLGGGDILTGEYGVAAAEGITHFALCYVWMTMGDTTDYWDGPWYYTAAQNSGKWLSEDGRALVLEYVDQVKELMNNSKSSLGITLTSDSGTPLSGATFGVYASENDAGGDSNRITTLTTDLSGNASVSLSSGTYYVKQLTAPDGYLKDEQAKPGTIKAPGVSGTLYIAKIYPKTKCQDTVYASLYQSDGSSTVLEFTNSPSEGYLALKKNSAEATLTNGSSCYSLAGAVYGVYVSKSDAGSDVNRIGTLTTVENGESNTLALAPGTYYVKEVTAPPGYKLDLSVHEVTVLSGKTATVESEESVIRGGVAIQKRDYESGLDTPQGAATFEGAEFTLYNENGHDVLVDTDGDGEFETYAAGSPITVLVTDENGFAQTSADLLPYGSYRIVETKAPYGYLKEGDLERKFEIREEGVIVDMTAAGNSITDKVKRGDVEFIKVAESGDSSNMKRLANVPFRITSLTTGESHIIVTDINGQASTASSWNAHSYNTNAGETSEDGVWFYGYAGETEGTAADDALPVSAGHVLSASIDDESGALPYDTYLLEELPCEANEGYTLVRVQFTVYRDSTAVDLGTLDDQTEDIGPRIITELTNGEQKESSGYEAHFAAASDDAYIIEEVTLINVNIGEEYTLKVVLTDGETGEVYTDANGNTYVIEKTVIPKASMQTVKVEFDGIDCAGLEGKSLVAYAYLYDKDGYLAASEELPDEEDETVYFPQITTEAAISETGEHVSYAEETVVITDNVSYGNVEYRGSFLLVGALYDAETGESILDADGNPITAETTFTAKDRDDPERHTACGTVTLDFEIDASQLAEKTVVACEYLYDCKSMTLMASETDLSNEDQSVRFIPVPEPEELPEITPEPQNTTPEPETKVPTARQTPLTGDGSNTAGWLACFVASVCALIAAVIIRSRGGYSAEYAGERLRNVPFCESLYKDIFKDGIMLRKAKREKRQKRRSRPEKAINR